MAERSNGPAAVLTDSANRGDTSSRMKGVAAPASPSPLSLSRPDLTNMTEDFFGLPEYDHWAHYERDFLIAEFFSKHPEIHNGTVGKNSLVTIDVRDLLTPLRRHALKTVQALRAQGVTFTNTQLFQWQMVAENIWVTVQAGDLCVMRETEMLHSLMRAVRSLLSVFGPWTNEHPFKRSLIELVTALVNRAWQTKQFEDWLLYERVA